MTSFHFPSLFCFWGFILYSKLWLFPQTMTQNKPEFPKQNWFVSVLERTFIHPKNYLWVWTELLNLLKSIFLMLFRILDVKNMRLKRVWMNARNLTIVGFSLFTCADQYSWAGKKSDVTKWIFLSTQQSQLRVWWPSSTTVFNRTQMENYVTTQSEWEKQSFFALFSFHISLQQDNRF